jgi:hypothetical protein
MKLGCSQLINILRVVGTGLRSGGGLAAGAEKAETHVDFFI